MGRPREHNRRLEFGPRSPDKASVVGAGVVAANGIGTDFFRACATGQSGTVLRNSLIATEKELNGEARPALRNYLSVDELRCHPAQKHFKYIEATGSEAAEELGRHIPDLAEVASETGWQPVPPGFEEVKVKDKSYRLDTFGVVPNERLYPLLLPLLALAGDKFKAEYQRLLDARNPREVSRRFIVELHLVSTMLVRLPRGTLLALVSTFLGILDAAHKLEAFEQELQQRVRADDLHLLHGGALTYIEKTVELFRMYLKASLEILRNDGRPVGLVVGTGVGGIDIYTRCEVRMSSWGLHGASDHRIHLERYFLEQNSDKKQQLKDAFTDDISEANPNFTAGFLARIFDLDGEQSTVATGCCSGASAVITGARMLDPELCPTVVVTGTDGGTWPELNVGFIIKEMPARLKAGKDQEQRARNLCRPYSRAARGWVIAEAATTVVLRHPQSSSGTERQVVTIKHGTVRNAASARMDCEAKHQVLRETLGAVTQGDGLVVGYGLGDRLRMGASMDFFEYWHVVEHSRQLRRDGSKVCLANIKGLTGHAMAGTSAAAVALSYWVLSRGWERQGLAPSLNLPLPEGADKPYLGTYDGHEVDNTSPLKFLRAGDDLEQLQWSVVDGVGLGGTSCAILLYRVDPQG